MKSKQRSEVKQFTVYRDRWLRGLKAGSSKSINLDDNESALYHSPTKTMCCLGFLARTAGLKVEDIKDCPTPNSVHSGIMAESRFPRILWGEDTKRIDRDTYLCKKIAGINDNESLSDKEREEFLVKEFKEAGVKVTFKDGKGYW